MYLIAGLGNPDKKYERTRHNMGYCVVDRIAKANNADFKKGKNAYELKLKMYSKDCILIKPTTYMNLSGIAIQEYMNYYKIPAKNIIVIYDEKDFEPGIVKIRKGGSSAGHNGIKSIREYVDDFVRVRVGIGKPKYANDMINHVIGKVSDEEYEELYEGVRLGEKAVIDIIKNGVDHAMNTYNRNEKKKENKKESKKGNEKEDGK